MSNGGRASGVPWGAVSAIVSMIALFFTVVGWIVVFNMDVLMLRVDVDRIMEVLPKNSVGQYTVIAQRSELNVLTARLDEATESIGELQTRNHPSKAWVDGVNTRLRTIGQELGGVDTRLKTIGQEFGGVDSRLNTIEQRLANDRPQYDFGR